MADQGSQTAANAPKPETRLCKMGCGFFGSGATEDCCSKCWNSMRKDKEMAVVPKPVEPVVEEEPTPMEVEEQVEEEPVMEEEPVVEVQAAPAPASKKKKKKPSYKNLMMGMTKCSPERDVEKDKESLRKVTGGGAFSKIDKI